MTGGVENGCRGEGRARRGARPAAAMKRPSDGCVNRYRLHSSLFSEKSRASLPSAKQAQAMQLDEKRHWYKRSTAS